MNVPMNVGKPWPSIDGRPTRVCAKMTLSAFNDAREFLSFLDNPEAALDQLMHYHTGRIWRLGEAGYSECPGATYLELEGVYAKTHLGGEDGARDLLVNWIKNAREAPRRHRESQT
ncbi:MAG: hypothetical protein AAFR88_05370 [Pseudomonadota bacterium]